MMNVQTPSAQPNAIQHHLQRLNETCGCLTLARAAVDARVNKSTGRLSTAELLDARPHLFANTAVLVSNADRAAMLAQICAIETVIAHPAYQAAIVERDGDKLLHTPPRYPGLFMGYDFHLTERGPRLIEINSNAGGAFLVNEMLAAANGMASPCGGVEVERAAIVAERLLALFRDEWRALGRIGELKRVAIVDDDPTRQYLYPDMQLAVSLLERDGIEAKIVDASELTVEGTTLVHENWPIDLVYNRLTDFALSEPVHAALREAWHRGLAVVSPNPDHHALYADKRNLELLGDNKQLEHWGIEASIRETLKQLPTTRPITPSSAPTMWAERKQWFFKPNSGFAGRAVYRGSKVTRKAWQTIVDGNFVAQSFIEPGRRVVNTGDAASLMKFDVRIYTYGGQPVVSAARIYQGQTTNFRSPGGGFAPVIYVG